jgi:hypothetical protein
MPSTSTSARDVSSPKTPIQFPAATTSHATRAAGSSARCASSTASETWSHSLSGWPSVTDSDVTILAYRLVIHRHDPVAAAMRGRRRGCAGCAGK